MREPQRSEPDREKRKATNLPAGLRGSRGDKQRDATGTREIPTCAALHARQACLPASHVYDETSERRKNSASALLHRVDVELPRTIFPSLRRNMAAGVGGVTRWKHEQYLEDRLVELYAGAHQRTFSTLTSWQKCIWEGYELWRSRATALADEIVQRAIVEWFNAKDEQNILVLSPGLCPRFGQHDALNALRFGNSRKKVYCILNCAAQTSLWVGRNSHSANTCGFDVRHLPLKRRKRYRRYRSSSSTYTATWLATWIPRGRDRGPFVTVRAFMNTQNWESNGREFPLGSVRAVRCTCHSIVSRDLRA